MPCDLDELISGEADLGQWLRSASIADLVEIGEMAEADVPPKFIWDYDGVPDDERKATVARIEACKDIAWRCKNEIERRGVSPFQAHLDVRAGGSPDHDERSWSDLMARVKKMVGHDVS